MSTAPPLAEVAAPSETDHDSRGSWLPTPAMVSTRLMELWRRRGLMITIAVVTIGLPTLFLSIRLVLHAAAPHSYGPAGGSEVFTGLVAGVLYVFGFIVAAALGCTAGSVDLTEGMFRHLVVTGRSRMAIYLARIPAGLAIITAMMAIGFTIICVVCTFAAPTTVSYNGTNVPQGLSRTAFIAWASDHAEEVVCKFNFDYNGVGLPGLNIPCNQGGIVKVPNGAPPPSGPTASQVRAAAVVIAAQNYGAYTAVFLAPPLSLMVDAGLWLLLEAAIGFIVGLGLGSLLGQRTVAIMVMVVLEVVLTPILARAHIPHLMNAQRGVVGIAMANLEPLGLSHVFGGGGGPGGRSELLHESVPVAVAVIVAWLVLWTALGAWRMMTRDA